MYAPPNGVADRSLGRGLLHLNDNIEVRVGLIKQDPATSAISWKHLYSKVKTLCTGSAEFIQAMSGALMGIDTELTLALYRVIVLLAISWGSQERFQPYRECRLGV